jgi:hypothetical protein
MDSKRKEPKATSMFCASDMHVTDLLFGSDLGRLTLPQHRTLRYLLEQAPHDPPSKLKSSVDLAGPSFHSALRATSGAPATPSEIDF